MSSTWRRLATTIACGASLGAQAILVTPGSFCSADCGNILDSNSPADIVCADEAYSQGVGPVFQGCVECEMRSRYHEGNDSDVQSMLNNLRYALSFCLFGEPNNTKTINSPCITSKACGPFQESITSENFSTQSRSYNFCEKWPVEDEADFTGCTECLRAAESFYLANFIVVLQAGCQQRPGPGIDIGLDGEIFSTNSLKASVATPTATIDPVWFDNGPLTLGAKVGVGFGGLFLLLLILGCAIIFFGKRRRKAYLRRLGSTWRATDRPMGDDIGDATERTLGRQQPWGDTPISQQRLRQAWGDSPVTASPDGNSKVAYFSPYSSRYNSPVSPCDEPGIRWPTMAAAGSRGSGTEPWQDGCDKGPGAVEMVSVGEARRNVCQLGTMGSAAGEGKNGEAAREVARAEPPPLLAHPGYGRAAVHRPKASILDGSG